jgi:alkylation response protein AidB-like acyl-CoA dehydrogenase
VSTERNPTVTSDTSDLRYSETEIALRDNVRSVLGKELNPADVIGLHDEPGSVGGALWTTLARDLGLAALLVPEAHRGYGNGAREAAVVLEELGRTVAPVPFLTSAVLATHCLADLADEETLRALAAGDITAALTTPLTACASTFVPTVTQAAAGLSGTITSVADAASASVLIVPVWGQHGEIQIHAVDPWVSGLVVTPVLSLDMTRPLADLQFTNVGSRVISTNGDKSLSHTFLTGAALLASEQVGLAEWCLETTVAYLQTRIQFGRPLGSFQALKHRLADLFLDLTTARAVARYAADAVATGSDDLPIAAALAQAHCSAIAVRAAEECIQLHGGIGMTWEHPAHLYLKRAKADQLALGTAATHRARLAQLVDLPVA